MTILEICIICIFAFSLIANFLYVIFNRQLGKYTARWDIFRLISSYQLFDLSPGTLGLFYRDQLPSNEFTKWKEIPFIMPKKWYHLILFPENFVPDVIFTYVDDLSKANDLKIEKQKVVKSFIYRTLLNYILRFPKAENATARQFKIIETQGFLDTKKDKDLFLSELHTY